MKKPNKNSNTASLLRTPKAKNKLGLKIKPIAMPHDDLIKAENSSLELVPAVTNPSQTTQTSQPTHTRQTTQTSQASASGSIAPERDYQKVANSISKTAVPAGLFKGKSKQLYDALYAMTRGAIKPTRTVRATKTKLMKLADIGSRITFDTNIRHLQNVGLIDEKIFPGEHEGNEFTVLLPEEALISVTSQTSQSSLTSPAQKLDTLLILETSQTSQSSEPMITGVSDIPKTSFKDSLKLMMKRAKSSPVSSKNLKR